MDIYCGDMWDYLGKRSTLIVPINRIVKPDGKLVMGLGVAEQARKKVHSVDVVFGADILAGKKICHYPYNLDMIVGISTKNHFRDKTTQELFYSALDSLQEVIADCRSDQIITPLLGAGAGGLMPTFVYREMRERFIDTDLIISVTRTDYDRLFTGKYTNGTLMRQSR